MPFGESTSVFLLIDAPLCLVLREEIESQEQNRRTTSWQVMGGSGLFTQVFAQLDIG